MSPAPEYRYILDADYLRTSEARAAVYQAHWRRWLPLGLFTVIIGFVAWTGRDRAGQSALTILLVTLFSWYFLRKERRKQRERFRGTPLENASLHITFGPDGFDVEVASSRSHDPWSVVTRARTFEDGLLLFEANQNYRWLPHACLSGASPGEAEEWVRARVSDFARAP